MATGLEALGAACAIVQLIQFSLKVVVGFKEAYDGEPTDHNVLEAYVNDMHENSILVDRRFQSLDISKKSPPVEQELQGVANRCRDTARQLQIELRYVTKDQQRGDCTSAISYMFKSLLRRGRIERLRRSLDMERKLMETRLLMAICSQNDAKDLLDDQRFTSLENYIKIVIRQISKGHYKLEALILAEHKTTRDIIMRESANTRQTVKNVLITESQRRDFLESLRFPEMKKRYNDLKGSGEVSFGRVFASYESMSSKEVAAGLNEATVESPEAENSTDMSATVMEDDRDIDSTWSVFKQWLTTSHPLFCIQGKPGSGKSTLSKFIIDNPNTKSLLSQWSPQPIILSHFFWKIGSTTQNSIKGLLCSLVYHLLDSDKSLQEQVMESQPSTSYKYYEDWSSGDLKNIFRYIAESQHHHIFIFIDGIDEIGNSDGIPNLIQTIEELLHHPQVKICVSSRPDRFLATWLRNHNACHICLEALTKPEMITFAFKELEHFIASGAISEEACQLLTNRIVKKAQGVFLWVHLVLRSVTTGIRNEDPEEILLRRLDKLPSELADLYAKMWRRMNEDSPYAEVAARYFHYVLYSDETLEIASYSLGTLQYYNRYHGPMLLQIVCAEKSNLQEFLIRPKVDQKYADLMQLCNETKKGIEVRCAGLLQTSHQTFRKSKHATPSSAKEVWPLRVEFIHRTAHDFLTDTEEGRNILQLHKQTPGETRISLFKGLLSLACIHFYKYGARAKLSSFLSDLHGLYETLEPHHGYEKNELLELLPILKRLYENNVIRDMVLWRPNPEFLTYLAKYPLFRAFIISTLSGMSLPKSVATQVLQETCQLPTVTGQRNDFLHLKKLTEHLLSVGAEPHFFEICPRSFREAPFVHKKSAFLHLLENAVHVTFDTREYQEAFIAWALPLMLDMSATCPDLEASILSCFDVAPHHNSEIGRWFHVCYPQIRLVNQFCIIFEVRLSFLVAYVITRLKPYTKEIANAMRIDKVLTCLQVSSPNFLYVIRGHETAPTPQICERVSNGSSCQELTDTLFQLHGGRPELLASYGADRYDVYALGEIIWSMTRLLTLERADFEISMLSLTEKELNFYSLPQLCIIPSSSWFMEVKDSGCSDIFPRTLKELGELSEKTLEEAHVSE